MEISQWAPVMAALGGVGGMATVLRVFGERSRYKGDLAISLQATAREWVEYIDAKFDEVSTMLDNERKDRRKREIARVILAAKHIRWDEQIKHDYEVATGKRAPDPPPFILPEER